MVSFHEGGSRPLDLSGNVDATRWNLHFDLEYAERAAHMGSHP